MTFWFCLFGFSFSHSNISTFLHGIPYKNFFLTTQHNKSTVCLHLIYTSHHHRARRIRSFLLPYQRSQQEGWVAASGPTVSQMEAPEVCQGDWWCLVLVDTPYPWGRSPWTSATGRGQKREGGCYRPREPLPSGRTQPQRAQTALRSTSLKPRLDSELKTGVSLSTFSLTLTPAKQTCRSF